MSAFLIQHPYFFANLMTLAGVHVTGYLFLKPNQNKAIILCGLINMTAFPFLIFLENEYWKPVRIGGGSLSIEDALCSYDVAALLWLILSFGVTISEAFEFRWGMVLRRFLLSGLLIGFVFTAGCFLGLRGMTSLLVTQIFVLPFLYCLKPKIWPLVLRGLLLYPLIYFVIVKFYFWIWPDFIRQWNLDGPWGTMILGVPLGEFAWAVGFALWWPPFFAFICNLDLRKNHRGVWVLTPCHETGYGFDC
jgi:hypothetical protein